MSEAGECSWVGWVELVRELAGLGTPGVAARLAVLALEELASVPEAVLPVGSGLRPSR